MSGAAEGSYGIHLNYLPYLLLHTPVLGILKGLILIGLICWLFPGKPHAPKDLTPSEPMSGDEKRLAWLLAVVLTSVGHGELARHWPRVDGAGGGCITCCHALGLSMATSFPLG
jgi:hypothetical protein